MNELFHQARNLTEDRTEAVIANEINYIKRRTCETVLSASVEIGRLLCEAKTKVSTGAWMSWLKDNVNYSQSTANNLMRLYEEYGEKEQLGFFEENRIEIFGDISPSQALALIALPYAQRKEYVQTHDMSEMSVRDINAEIKERKDAEEREKELEKELDKARNDVAEIEAKESDYLSEIEDLKNKIAELEKQASNTELISEKEIHEVKAEIKKKMQKKIDELQKKIDLTEKSHTEEIEKAKKAAAQESEAKFTQRLEELSQETKSLKKKAEAAASGSIQRLSAYLELFQNIFLELISSLDKLREEGNENAQKLSDGIKGILDTMKEKL